MAFTNPTNWTNLSYTASTWTALVSVPSVVAVLIVTNPTAAAINISLRLTASGAIIVPETEVAAGSSMVLEARSISIPAADGIQCWADAVGVHFIASGVAE